MFSAFLLIFMVIAVVFCFSTVVGSVMALIEIIRSPKRYKVSASADEIPADFFDPASDEDVFEENSEEIKRVIT